MGVLVAAFMVISAKAFMGFCYSVHDDFCYNAYGGSCGGVERGAGEEAGKEVMAKQGDREKEYLCFFVMCGIYA